MKSELLPFFVCADAQVQHLLVRDDLELDIDEMQDARLELQVISFLQDSMKHSLSQLVNGPDMAADRVLMESLVGGCRLVCYFLGGGAYSSQSAR